MKKMMIMFVVLGLVVSGEVLSQERTITGKVTAADDGSVLPGVNVLLKGTTTGTVTNRAGEYSIKIPSSGGHLVFSFIGLTTQQVEIGQSNRIDVIMQSDITQLNEVIVTGYVVQEKRSITGSVASVRLRGGRSMQKSYSSADGYFFHQPRHPLNTEEYKGFNENIFLDALTTPRSTFSIDVDAASYSNLRRFLTQGERPPVDAVRIEEMINYFDYDYAQPKGDDPFSITTEISAAPWNTKHKLVHIGLQGLNVPKENLPPTNLVFLIDVSGSMAEPNKLPLLKSSFRLLVEQLREQDRVAIVVYAGAAGMVLPSTSGNDKKTIMDALNHLEAGGSTAGGAGIKLAYAMAKQHFIDHGNNRVVLATDGDFNVGESRDGDLERLIEQKRKDGIFLTVLGFGMGNYKDSKMETLADKGNGNYFYIDSILEAQKALENEFGGTLFTIAKDVKLQIEFNPAKVKSYRLIGYENRLLRDEDFNNDQKDAGELGSGHSVTALYEIIPVCVDSDFNSVDPLKYQKAKPAALTASTHELMTVKFRYKKPDGHVSKLIVHPLVDQNISLAKTSDNFRWSAAVAGVGMLLRESTYARDFSFQDAIQLAQSARGSDANGYRIEFINMIKSCSVLAIK
jgi:Ca-activated chloride channel family protein